MTVGVVQDDGGVVQDDGGVVQDDGGVRFIASRRFHLLLPHGRGLRFHG